MLFIRSENLLKELQVKIKQQGLTLIQMLSLIGFIGVLVAIAVPYAQSYVAKEQFSPTLLGMETYKAAVESCIAQLGTHEGCNSGLHGIPVKIDMVAADEQNKNGVSGYVVQDGVITAEHYAPIAGVAYPTYKLVARAKGSLTEWEANPPGKMGTCVAAVPAFC